MMGTEDKTLFCYCRWGWKEKVLPDGLTLYVGGVTRQIIVKTGVKYNDFVSAVFDRLGIVDPSDKILQFTVKFHKSRLIDLSDQKDVDALLQFNDGSADVYASSLVKEPYSITPSGSEKNVEFTVVSGSKPDTAHVLNDENDLAILLKKALSIQSGGDSVERLNQKGAGLPEGDVLNNSCKIGIFNGQASKMPSSGGKVIVVSDSEPDTTLHISQQVNQEASIPPSVGTYYENPKELYLFSHRIPSFKMSGTERKGVSGGSYELNPNYALPLIPNDIWYPGKVKETANFKLVENVLSADKSRTSEHATTSLKTGNLKDVHPANRELFPVTIDLELKL